MPSSNLNYLLYPQYVNDFNYTCVGQQLPSYNTPNKRVLNIVLAGTILMTMGLSNNYTPTINIGTLKKPNVVFESGVLKNTKISELQQIDNEQNKFRLTISGGSAYNYTMNSEIYSDSKEQLSGGVDMLQIKNINKLNEFSKLAYNWNGYGAEEFSYSLIQKLFTIIRNINYEPEIFPTGRQSIQLEYENNSGKYLELEVYDEKVDVLFIHENDDEEEFSIPNDINEINKVVSMFYGRDN